MSYKEKYLKYKNKYLNLKNYFGGGDYDILKDSIIKAINARDLITLKNTLVFIYNIEEQEIKDKLKKDTSFSKLAIKNGLIGCLMALLNYGYQFDKSVICDQTAPYCHLEFIKYAHKNGCPWNKNTCLEAAKHGHLECLEYAH